MAFILAGDRAVTLLRVVAWLAVDVLDTAAGVLSAIAGRLERELL